MTATEILIFLKPITDMWYQFPILDYALMGLACIIFIVDIKRIKKLYMIDSIVIAIVLLLTLTLIRSNYQGVVIYIKMISAYILYFIGRACGGRIFNERKYLVCSGIIVLGANLITLITRTGFQTWGHATTFSGLYYFKTDLAIGMNFVMITLMYFSNFKKKYIWIATILCAVMIVLSNARIDMIILLIILGIYFLWFRERKTGKQLRINIKYVGIGIAVFIGAIFLISKMLELPMFQQYNFISFSVNNILDIYSASNTSGRNVVWEAILKIFNNQTLGTRLIGVDFVSDIYFTFDSHNAYLKMMFCTGYLGLGLFILFLFLYMAKLNLVQNRNLFYFNLSLLIVFVLQSLSASTVAYTQSTWIFMMFLGVAITNDFSQQKEPKKIVFRLRR